MKKVQDAVVKDKKVLLRVDFNVPLKNGHIENDKRIREALPTIKYLIEEDAKEIVLTSHLGKPDGKKDTSLSLWPIANCLAKLLEIEKEFKASEDQYKLNDQIVLLENIRFDKREEENDSEFAKMLAQNFDLFVNDAFGTLHRAHATTEGVTHYLPSYAGLLVQKEVEKLAPLLTDIESPFTFILGGAKIADKLPVIKNFSTRADTFLIGGAIANTFLAARRHYLGKSLVESDSYREANIIWASLMDEAKRNIYLPVDVVLSKSLKEPLEMIEVSVAELLEPKFEDYFVVDIGSKTIETYIREVAKSKTIFWNGAMGVSEIKEFANGTNKVAEAVLNSGAEVIIGGGDTVGAIESLNLNIPDNVFLSTGGGATLEFLSGKQLPGLKALEYYN